MSYSKSNPAGRPGSFRLQSNGQELQGNYTTNQAPASFWKGFNGTESIAPPIHRRQPKAKDTLWNPRRARGRP